MKFLSRRLASFVIALMGCSIIIFSMLWLTPGDPVTTMMWRTGASSEQMAQMRETLGLNDPLPVQYLRFVNNALHGDLGRSIGHKEAVTEMIGAVLGQTIQLTLAALLLAISVGVPMGILAGLKPNSWLDISSMVLAQIGISMPHFWLGLILIFIFSFQLRLLPSTGSGGIDRLILPAVTLAVPEIAVIARVTRSNIMEVMNQDYVRTARAKGLFERLVVVRHVLPNAAIPVITLLGLQLGMLLGGAYIVEFVFARPGLGRVAVDAILEKDFQVAQGAILLTAVVYMFINLAVDLLYAVLDPRIRTD